MVALDRPYALDSLDTAHIMSTVSASILGSFNFRQISILVARMTKPMEEIAICLKSKLPKIKAGTVPH